ncbi:MAG: hypothetical protein PWP27_38 [Clostridiales bacterium]|jgi:hypothetical protein|nr:hypothetical protein [Clostridiales bacterium]MDK2932228.1 hypothetical protein [Clostridiales bacterium]
MLITVNLMSQEKGEIKRFIDNYFEKESDVDTDVVEWIYVYRNSMEAADIIDVLMDNYNDYNISLWVQIDDEDITEVTKHNRSKIMSKMTQAL